MDQQYALTHSGQVIVDRKGDRVITGFLKEQPADNDHGGPPGSEWLPVESADAVPFESERHYRGTPSYRVEAARVVRVYPIIPKSEDTEL